MKSAEKKYKIPNTEFYCASKDELIVAMYLLLSKERFIHDKKYDYDDSGLKRFDFMILNKSDEPDNIKTKHHIYIEVKPTNKEIEELLKEKDFVENHGDILITIVENEFYEHIFNKKIKEAKELLKLRNQTKVNAYRYKKNKKNIKSNPA